MYRASSSFPCRRWGCRKTVRPVRWPRPDDAVAYASRKGGGRKRPATGWASLTPAELEVVRLAGEGLRNDAIARRLFIAPGTVKVHLSHIFAKLGITTRAELAAQAASQELTVRRSQS